MRSDAGFLITLTDACLGSLDPARLAELDSSGDQSSKILAEARQRVRDVLDRGAEMVSRSRSAAGRHGLAVQRQQDQDHQLVARPRAHRRCRRGDADALLYVITRSAGNSLMFESRMAHALAGDYTPLSAVDIFVKDLGLVLDTARTT